MTNDRPVVVESQSDARSDQSQRMPLNHRRANWYSPLA